MLPFAVGAILALLAGVFATGVGLDRDRAFYPTVMIVIAVLYALFAVMGDSTRALVLELVAGSIFIAAAVIGFKRSLRIVSGALIAHGLFDFVHGYIIANPGVPPYWPAFCGSYDVVAGLYLAMLLQRRRSLATA